MLALSCAGPAPSPREGRAAPSPAEPPPTPGLLIVGVDSMSWDVVDELRRTGVELPNLAALEARGVRARLRTLTPTISPNIWTTIATGRLPEVHGIWSFQTRQVVATPVGDVAPRAAPRAIVTSADRKVRALWEMAGERGMRADVIGWWVTWPAGPPPAAGGVLVSDRFAQEGLPGRVAPGEEQGVVDALLARATPEVVKGPELGAGASAESLGFVGRFARSDWVLAEEAKRRLSDGEGSVVMVYLRGLDPVCHRFWKFWKPQGYGLHGDALAVAGRVVPDYYRYVDRLLGELAAARGDRPLLLVSDHGMSGILGTPALLDVKALLSRLGVAASGIEGDFLSTESTILLRGVAPEQEARLAAPRVIRLDAPLLNLRRQPDGALRLSVERRARPDDVVALGEEREALSELTAPPPEDAHSGVHEDAPDGVFLLAGGGARAGATAEPLSVVDVLPAALALLGLPVAEDMPGVVPASLFATPPAVTRIPTYDETPRRTEAAPAVPAHDSQLEDELRGLGYLGR